MDLKLSNRQFLVTGGTSGFGGAISRALANEGANVIAVARNREKLQKLENEYPGQIITIQGDITQSDTIKSVSNEIDTNVFDGAVINSGGPPAKAFLETNLQDWDDAYNNLMRWKIEITQKLLPHFQNNDYGRLVYIESISTKQPVENLVLSNSLRLGVVGFVKTLSQEMAGSGINMNILAPGYHDTAALNRIFRKKSEVEGISEQEARKQFEQKTPMGLGKPDDMATLALWLLSPHSRYVTGQTISHDGSVMKGVFG
ncbi:MAG: SDR family oxidoreductase [Bacteroidales bacterium]|nr:SDR family oxidoreductase [Bacteroidales bacterium]MCF8334739.1 SDR family oxidoreductase [Bacteroidales bacterium]